MPDQESSDAERDTRATRSMDEPWVAATLADTGELEPGTALGDWQIEGVLGVGGMGTVYQAVHSLIGKRAAIKVVRSDVCASPQTRDRFVQEARVVNQIGHPNIVDIFHIGQLDDGRPYLVMELLRGCTLGARMFEGRVPATEAVGILLQVCEALTAAHGHGVIHRDLKPENIFLDDSAGTTTVKLVDWGIAKLVDDDVRSGTLTLTGTLIGTPQYMSPEQARGKSVDGRADLYSLGAIAYELFLEGPPFAADNIADLVTMHLREEPPPPRELWPDIPPALDQLLLGMLAKAAADRPSMERVVSTLRSVRDQLERRGLAAAGRGFGSEPGTSRGLMERVRTWAMPLPAPGSTTEEMALPGRGIVRMVAWSGGFVLAAVVLLLVLRDPSAIIATTEAAATPADDGEVAAAATDPDVEQAILAGHGGLPATGTLEVRVDPAHAVISIDGVAVDLDEGLTVRPVEPGLHLIEVEAPGFRRQRREIEVGLDGVLVEISLDRAKRQTDRTVRSHKRSAERRRSAPPIIDPDGTIDPFE